MAADVRLKRKERTRRVLIAAAIQRFARDGLGEAKTADIALEAIDISISNGI
jgi:AcrR family transcriptional regulator